MTVKSVRRRLRANVEIWGVSAFWEGRSVGDDAPDFAVGDVRFKGVKPCGRCVVPQRDPGIGESIPEFCDRFVRSRRETFSEWANEIAFDHYSTMTISWIPEADRERTLRVGDAVDVLD